LRRRGCTFSAVRPSRALALRITGGTAKAEKRLVMLLGDDCLEHSKGLSSVYSLQILMQYLKKAHSLKMNGDPKIRDIARHTMDVCMTIQRGEVIRKTDQST